MKMLLAVMVAAMIAGCAHSANGCKDQKPGDACVTLTPLKMDLTPAK